MQSTVIATERRGLSSRKRIEKKRIQTGTELFAIV